ncbi:MAG: hypothetical protein JZU65_21695, partial [Chlorobium sp.]|nr:hypothetical protein [Chlorobium sp.]
FVKGQDNFFLHTAEKDVILFTDAAEMETALVEMFDIDACWDEMTDRDLAHWHEAISSKGISFIEMTEHEDETFGKYGTVRCEPR